MSTNEEHLADKAALRRERAKSQENEQETLATADRGRRERSLEDLRDAELRDGVRTDPRGDARRVGEKTADSVDREVPGSAGGLSGRRTMDPGTPTDPGKLTDTSLAIGAELPEGVGDRSLDGLLGDLPDLRQAGSSLPLGKDGALIASGTVGSVGSVGGNQAPVRQLDRSFGRDPDGNPVVVTTYGAGIDMGDLRSGSQGPDVTGTATVTTHRDGTTTTLVQETLKMGDGSSVMAQDDGTTRTETWINPDGTVQHTSSTTRSTDSEGRVTTQTVQRDADGAITSTTTRVVDPLGVITTTDVDADGNVTTTVTDEDGNELSGPSEAGDYPTDTSGSGSTDDDSDNGSDDGTDDGGEDDTDAGSDDLPADDSGTAVAWVTDGGDGPLGIGGIDPTRLDLVTITTGGTVLDDRTTNTGNPDLQPEGPSFDLDDLLVSGDDEPRGDDLNGGSGELDPQRLDPFTVTIGGTVLDDRTTNTGNPDLRPEGPQFDPSLIPPDLGNDTVGINDPDYGDRGVGELGIIDPDYGDRGIDGFGPQP